MDAAIASAMRTKEAVERKERYWKQVINAPQHPRWITAEELLEGAIHFSIEDKKPIVIDDDNRELLTLLSWYFAGDKRFESAAEGYSLSKGLYIYGAVGIGKTYIMKLFTDMQRKPFRMKDCSDISAEFKKEGEEGITKYFRDIQIHERHEWGHTERGWCFDDLGTESDGRYFGNQVNVMERIFEVRYRNHERLTTHIISNLTVKQVEERYGVRIRERLREMMNVVYFTASKSRRK